ncbi:hypothetical protein HD554DRAFT_2329595 [Boletus coccyginus]|nr:hypothetical protein HD554DRAFT_2329595 [Boletus coccyginus]
MTGFGGTAGYNAAINTTAKSFPSIVRATTTGLVVSGIGLSAFWYSLLAHTLFPGDISALLLILALGTAIPMLVGLLIVKPIPLNPTSSYALAEGYDFAPSEDNFALVGMTQVALDAEADFEEEADSAPLLLHEQEFNSDRSPLSPPASIRLDIVPWTVGQHARRL